MSDQYVFELHFQRRGKKDDRENQFVIIDGSSMADFQRLKDDLSMCMPEPFTVLYIDDEEDIITIDSEDEFHEFAKIAKSRSSRGMLMRLILNASSKLSPSDNKKVQHPSSLLNRDNLLGDSAKDPSSCHAYDHLVQKMQDILKLKDNIKTEVKQEIMSELHGQRVFQREKFRIANNFSANLFEEPSTSKQTRMGMETREVQSEEDTHYLPSPSEKKKSKLVHSALNSQKKLEKREKLLESKIDHRLEKLEMKKRKLWEKFNQKALDLRLSNTPLSAPHIVSVIASQESSEMKKPVSPNKTFSHTWVIMNDGTVPLDNYVELRHTWSTPGLEPKEPVLKCPPLLPGQIGTISVTFNAPRIQSNSFISYWNFYDSCKEFGHYVSLMGNVKQGKPEEEKSAKEGCKMMEEVRKEEGRLRKKVAMESLQVEVKQEQQVILQRKIKQLKDTLASSEIAAEMAEQAARLLARATAAAERNSAAKAAGPCEANTLNGQEVEEAAAGVQQLNLMDTGSDSDANAEGGEDTDRGFVFVNMASEPKDGSKRKIREDEGYYSSHAMPTDNLSEAKAQPEPVTPKVDVRVHYPTLSNPPFPRPSNAPIFPSHPPQPTLSLPMPPPAPPVFLRQPIPLFPNPEFPAPLRPNQFPVFPGTDNNVVFPPPMNFGIGPVPYPQPPFIPVSGPPTYILANQNQNESRPFSQPQTENAPAEPAQNMTPTEDAAKSEQESNAGSVSTVAVEPEAHQPAGTLEEPVNTTPTAPEQGVTSNPVQILPQVLVDGAINVAATAYSTAWNAITNLRSKDETAEFDPVFENNMAMLVEMGFNNVERNARLLRRYHNDISQVIGFICAAGNLDID